MAPNKVGEIIQMHIIIKFIAFLWSEAVANKSAHWAIGSTVQGFKLVTTSQSTKVSN